jgi:hypothetical protein
MLERAYSASAGPINALPCRLFRPERCLGGVPPPDILCAYSAMCPALIKSLCTPVIRPKVLGSTGAAADRHLVAALERPEDQLHDPSHQVGEATTAINASRADCPASIIGRTGDRVVVNAGARYCQAGFTRGGPP